MANHVSYDASFLLPDQVYKTNISADSTAGAPSASMHCSCSAFGTEPYL